MHRPSAPAPLTAAAAPAPAPPVKRDDGKAGSVNGGITQSRQSVSPPCYHTLQAPMGTVAPPGPAQPPNPPGTDLLSHLWLGCAGRHAGAQHRSVHHICCGLALRGRQQRAQGRLCRVGGSRRSRLSGEQQQAQQAQQVRARGHCLACRLLLPPSVLTNRPNPRALVPTARQCGLAPAPAAGTL